jgi:nicotinamide-nucleotide amidase
LPLCAEIIAIGDELLYGRVYDTNSFWLAEQLTQLGLKVQRITCIGDDVETIVSALEEAHRRGNSFIISTGGLGPTQDDRTIEAASTFSQRPVTTEGTILQALAARRNLPIEDVPPTIRKMSQTLEGATCIPGVAGWAPATIFQKDGTTFILLPGPPKEVKELFQAASKIILEKSHQRSTAARVTVNAYESQVAPTTEHIMKTLQGTYLKPLVGQYTPGEGLPIDIVAYGETEEDCKRKLEKAKQMLREELGDKLR